MGYRAVVEFWKVWGRGNFHRLEYDVSGQIRRFKRFLRKNFINVVTRDGSPWLGRRVRKVCNLDIEDRRKWPPNSLNLGHFFVSFELFFTTFLIISYKVKYFSCIFCIFMHDYLFMRKAQFKFFSLWQKVGSIAPSAPPPATTGLGYPSEYFPISISQIERDFPLNERKKMQNLYWSSSDYI